MNALTVFVSTITEGSGEPLREAAAGSGEEPAEPTPGRTPPVVENEEALFPKERIRTLLDAYDGRMWQQDVIAETGYSAGRVSRLLSEMEAEDQITRYWKDGSKVVADPELLPAALTEN